MTVKEFFNMDFIHIDFNACDFLMNWKAVGKYNSNNYPDFMKDIMGEDLIHIEGKTYAKLITVTLGDIVDWKIERFDIGNFEYPTFLISNTD